MFQATKDGTVLQLKFEDFMVNSGQWHNVDVTWADREIRLTLDFIHTRRRAHGGITPSSHANKPVQLTLFIGGKEVFNASKRIIQKGFEGCIQGKFSPSSLSQTSPSPSSSSSLSSAPPASSSSVSLLPPSSPC